MYDLLICELCGTTFKASKNHDLCSSCYSSENEGGNLKKELEDKRAEPKFLGWKALKGSAKQKIWAEEIRKKTMLNNTQSAEEEKFLLINKLALL